MLNTSLLNDLSFNETVLNEIPVVFTGGGGGGSPNCRLGDTSTHGGAIITASHNTRVNGIPEARLGDILLCPLHGPNPIVTGAPRAQVNGRLIARIGDLTACGAALSSGSHNTRTGN
jgi:uncharacterized Zn-binding protein involved in type VI secretion